TIPFEFVKRSRPTPWVGSLQQPLPRLLPGICKLFPGAKIRSHGRRRAVCQFHHLSGAEALAGDGAYLVRDPLRPLNVAAPLLWPKHPPKLDAAAPTRDFSGLDSS